MNPGPHLSADGLNYIVCGFLIEKMSREKVGVIVAHDLHKKNIYICKL